MTLGNGQVWSNSLDQDGRVKTYTLAGGDLHHRLGCGQPHHRHHQQPDRHQSHLRLRQPGSHHQL